MNQVYQNFEPQIPFELKELYQEVSKTFERKVVDAVKTIKSKEVHEETKALSQKPNIK